MQILKRKYKGQSHQTIEDIKRMQRIHREDLIQPRREGELNPEYVKRFGVKNLNISDYDVRTIAKKDRGLLKQLDERRRQKYADHQ